jgi:hypothetical protein
MQIILNERAVIVQLLAPIAVLAVSYDSVLVFLSSKTMSVPKGIPFNSTSPVDERYFTCSGNEMGVNAR